MVMTRVGTALVAGLCVIASTAAAGAAGWQQVGQQYVDYRTSPVVFQVKPDAPALTQLKLLVRGSAFEIDRVTVTLASGKSFEVTLNAFVAPGRETRAIDIPGGPQAVQRVELVYRSGSRDGKIALVKLLGAS
jgi:hypothetical protein